ncbi:MAG: hypothetical protein EOO77_04520 [Oxalobacteraceae bacterium]|nr:MAG: hypothetical protein EOO77_04520 [Oxalobacteraceae bacterium]
MDDTNSKPFGYVDHSAFAGFGVDLVWGLDADGEAVHIDRAERGLACGLICPACRATLIARKGTRKAAHFSHKGKDSGCGSGRETNARYWAKQLLVERKQIWTPVVKVLVEGVSRRASEAKWMIAEDGGEFIGISEAGEGFAVTGDEWQATLLNALVSVHDVRAYEDSQQRQRAAVGCLYPRAAWNVDAIRKNGGATAPGRKPH